MDDERFKLIETRLRRETPAELVFTYRHGWGWASVAFALAVLSLALTTTRSFPLELRAYVVSLTMLGLGLYQICQRDRLCLDVEAHTYHRRSGPFWAPRAVRGSLDDAVGVVLVYDPPRFRWFWDLSTAWRVKLAFKSALDRPVLFRKTRDESAAYGCLEHYARLLRVPALDRADEGEERLLDVDPEPARTPVDASLPEADAPPATVADHSMSLVAMVGMPPAASGIELRGGPGREAILLPKAVPWGGRLQIERAGNFLRFSTDRDGRRHRPTSRRRRACAQILHRREIREIDLRQPLVGDRSQERQLFIRSSRGIVRVGRRLDLQSLAWLLDAVQAMAQPAVYPLAA